MQACIGVIVADLPPRDVGAALPLRAAPMPFTDTDFDPIGDDRWATGRAGARSSGGSITRLLTYSLFTDRVGSLEVVQSRCRRKVKVVIHVGHDLLMVLHWNPLPGRVVVVVRPVIQVEAHGAKL